MNIILFVFTLHISSKFHLFFAITVFCKMFKLKLNYKLGLCVQCHSKLCYFHIADGSAIPNQAPSAPPNNVVVGSPKQTSPTELVSPQSKSVRN